LKGQAFQPEDELRKLSRERPAPVIVSLPSGGASDRARNVVTVFGYPFLCLAQYRRHFKRVYDMIQVILQYVVYPIPLDNSFSYTFLLALTRRVPVIRGGAVCPE
jgi:hypothetical protein